MIATVCDEGDFLHKVTRPAIQSFARHMPDAPFCLVLINASGRFDAEIRSWHPRLILKNYPLAIREAFRRGYQFCYMTLPLHDLLVEFNEPLIYVDADTLLRGRLDTVFDLLRQYDIVARYLPFQALPGPTTEMDGARINNGCLALANNDATRRYTAELRRRVIAFLESGRDPSRLIPETGTVTGLDQELLWVIYREMKDALRFFPLDDRFNDAQLHDHSVLWHAKGTARRNPRYLFEVARFDGNRMEMARLGPRKLAMDLFRTVRSRTWRANLRRAFTLPDLAWSISTVGRDRLLVVNSCFLRHNPALLDFDQVDCIDVDPVWYHECASELAAHGQVRHQFRMSDQPWPMDAYDLIVADRHVPGVHARTIIQQANDLGDELTWRRTRILRRPTVSITRLGGSGIHENSLKARA
jgi:hypothetical protein